MRPTALITGAGARVGRATALELARSGFDLAVHYHRSAEAAEQTAASCRELGADAFVVQGDLGSVSGCASVVEQVTSQLPALNLLVNNASAFESLAFEQISTPEWERMLAVNLRAPFLLSRDLLPSLRAAGEALVVHLVDIGADRPVSGYAHYSVAKAGLQMLVKAMAVELAPAIRTVGISPGQVAWPPDYSPELRASLTKRIPLQRVGTPEDIARLVRFLAVEGTYLNGEIIAVDGGLSKRY